MGESGLGRPPEVHTLPMGVGGDHEDEGRPSSMKTIAAGREGTLHLFCVCSKKVKL